MEIVICRPTYRLGEKDGQFLKHLCKVQFNMLPSFATDSPILFVIWRNPICHLLPIKQLVKVGNRVVQDTFA